MKIKNNETNYQNIWTWLIIGLMLLSFIFIFLFLGEINYSKLNWLVAVNGKKWGILSDGTYGYGINNGGVIINYYIFLVMVGVLLFSFITTLILIFINKVRFSSLAFVVSSWFIFFVITTSGLLYPKKDAFAWEVIVRILLVVITYPITFFPINYIIKKIFIKTKFGDGYINSLINDERINAKYINDIDKFNPKRKKNEKVIIEIKKDEI